MSVIGPILAPVVSTVVQSGLQLIALLAGAACVVYCLGRVIFGPGMLERWFQDGVDARRREVGYARDEVAMREQRRRGRIDEWRGQQDDWVPPSHGKKRDWY